MHPDRHASYAPWTWEVIWEVIWQAASISIGRDWASTVGPGDEMLPGRALLAKGEIGQGLFRTTQCEMGNGLASRYCK